MKIAIGCDHGGFRLKTELVRFLKTSRHSAKDFGAFDEKSCDYPLFAAKVGKAVASGKFKRGILVCKTGIGMAIAANKIKNVRAAVVHDMKTAVSSRQHNDCNVIVFGSTFIKPAKAKAVLKIWLATRSLGGRHRRRVIQMNKLEE
ncbi:MAG: ribose 5-phosphate isomerase B [Candidatus Omnitrophica bacterium]|nr:ribose 5-phosphate isomerase B [Candidatus Omnitrophota bacterium]